MTQFYTKINTKPDLHTSKCTQNPGDAGAEQGGGGGEAEGQGGGEEGGEGPEEPLPGQGGDGEGGNPGTPSGKKDYLGIFPTWLGASSQFSKLLLSQPKPKRNH